MMEKKIRPDLNDKLFTKYLKLGLFVSLLIMIILVCVQYSSIYISDGETSRLAAVILFCAFLAIVFSIDAFLINHIKIKLGFFGVETGFLVALGILTGNAYICFLHALTLSQVYISLNNLKINTILFIVSFVLFLASYVLGWVILHKGVSTYDTFTQILSESIYSLIILIVHYAVFNFLLTYYSQNFQLRNALKEADANHAELEKVYTQLSETAVFEERNRIARDIHDNAGHSMTAVIMQTEAAKLLIDTDPEEAKNKIVSANLQAKNALEQMRESVHLLAGWKGAETLKGEIEEIIAQTIDGADLKIRSDLEDLECGVEANRFIANTVKECLANGIRHGKATAFYVELKESLDGVRLLVDDNGCGTDEIHAGFGLTGIKNGAEKLGGKCEFSSEDGEGFQVEITLPYDKIKKEEEGK